MLVRNNGDTVARTLQSLEGLDARVVVGDLGSSDGTPDICRGYGAEVVRLKWQNDYSLARNALVADGMNMMIEPWEVLAAGAGALAGCEGNFNVTVVRGGVVSREIRLWRDLRFRNPAYETLEDDSAGFLAEVAIVSRGGPDRRLETLEICRAWAASRPTSPDPWYYSAFASLALGMTDEFLVRSERFMAMTGKFGHAEIQVCYRMAMALAARKEHSKAMQVVAGCIFHRPAFAEFWCLAGDIFLVNGDRGRARIMYLNALTVGSRRIASDPSPLELSKYKDHPEKMLAYLEEMGGGGEDIASRQG